MKKYLIAILIIIILILFGIIIFSKKNENVQVNDIISENQANNFDYKNPIIPDGFNKVETENASWELDENGDIKDWNNGLVIEDENGNQFVWIPVDINNLKYSKNVKIFRYTNSTIDDTIKRYRWFLYIKV